MKNKKIKDERIEQLTNKIQSEAYLVVMFLTAISCFIKSYVMDLKFSQYAVELGIVIVSTAYIAIRSMFVGHDLMNGSKGMKAKVASIIALSFAISIINGIRNYSLYSNKYSGVLDGLFISVMVVTFISALVFSSVVFVLLYWFNLEGQKRIERKLNEIKED